MRIKVLIVDEISMVDGDLFDKLEAIARTIRTTGDLGGIQLVITGTSFSYLQCQTMEGLQICV
jgi:ATP-dependent DNA helicase PIF1